MAKDDRFLSRKKPEPTGADKPILDAQPDSDRMGEIADRLLSTPPDRQALGKALAPKRKGSGAKVG